MKVITIIILCALVNVLFLTQNIFAAGSLNERNYKKLQGIHKLIEKNQLSKAKIQLDNFLSAKHSAYTQAIFLQTAAHVAIEQQHFPQAIKYLEKADALKALPDFVGQNIVYNLSQLYAQDDQLTKSLQLLERWLTVQKKLKKKVTSEQHIFAANLYGRQKKFKSAVKHVNQAIKNSNKPQESWYQLLISLYLQEKKYNSAIQTYHIVIKRFGANKTYWKQLSGLYLQTNNTQQALAVLELAEKQGMLSTEQEMMRLVDLYLYNDIPLSAAQLLEQKIAANIVKPTITNKQKLADSWILAQEYNKAIKVLEDVARQDSDNGQYQFKIGRLLMEQGEWTKAYQQFHVAEGKKQDKPGENLLLQGISAFYAKMPKKAEQALIKAAKFEKYNEKANLWLEQLAL